ncbi:MAG: hypothetical protein HYW49_11835 [Deltaproteobacteria bacterium]|nr:hypothetical protein [Deltaproteobacteria bacterium]
MKTNRNSMKDVFSKLAMFAALAAVAAPGPSFAGKGGSGRDVGNGGLAVVCRDSEGAIDIVEVLDLFEGRSQYGLNIPEGKWDVDTLLESAIVRLKSRQDFQRGVQAELAHVRSNLKKLPKNVRLLNIDDAFPLVIMPPCKFEQLAAYARDGKIYLDSELHKALTKTQEAALYLHEAIYKVARYHGAANSVQARKLNAHLFTETADAAAIDALVDELVGSSLNYR